MIETKIADFSKAGGSKVIDAEQAAALIPDGVTICSPIIGLTGWSEEIARAIAKRYEATGHPRELTLVCGSAMGNHKDKGPHVIGLEGLITDNDQVEVVLLGEFGPQLGEVAVVLRRHAETRAVVDAVVIEKHPRDVMALVQGRLGELVGTVRRLVLVRALVNHNG